MKLASPRETCLSVKRPGAGDKGGRRMDGLSCLGSGKRQDGAGSLNPSLSRGEGETTPWAWAGCFLSLCGSSRAGVCSRGRGNAHRAVWRELPAGVRGRGERVCPARNSANGERQPGSRVVPRDWLPLPSGPPTTDSGSKGTALLWARQSGNRWPSLRRWEGFYRQGPAALSAGVSHSQLAACQ